MLSIMATQDLNRLFAAGCSYTQYSYPTYVDYLSAGFSKTYNYGSCGAGNEFIFASAMHLIREFKPKDNDVLIVQWSALGRNDTIEFGKTGYTLMGSLDWQDFYPKEWVQKFVNPVQHGLMLINYADAIKAYADANNVRLIQTQMFDPTISGYLGEPYETTIFNKFKHYIRKYMPKNELKQMFKRNNFSRSIEEFILRQPKEERLYFLNGTEIQEDSHPSPYGHWLYACSLNEQYKFGIESQLNHPKVIEYRDFIDKIFKNPNLHRLNLVKEFGDYALDDFDQPAGFIPLDKKKGPASFFGKEMYLNEIELKDQTGERLL